MKCRYIKLTNYIGIKNGMNLNEIEIDFAKCKNKMVVILGDNGSGKTTLYNSLGMLPDSYSDLIPCVEAKKEGIWEDGDVAYHVTIFYNLIGNPENNKRETKAYIKKMVFGRQPEEMNPNGNVTSYKDYLFNEFSLDANFVALSQLSSEKRGIVDKTPVERKKYVSSILSMLEVYNNIHKTISKRSSTFKAVMNSITTKLGNLGDIERIKISINATEARINKLENDKKSVENSLSEANATIKLLDPDGSIQNRYQEIANAVNALDNQNTINEGKVTSLLNDLRLNESENIEGKYNDLKKLIAEVEANIHFTEAQISKDMVSREEEGKSIQLKTDKLKLLKTDDNEDIELAIKNSENRIKEYEMIYQRINLPKDSILTKDEYITGLNTLKSIKEAIDNFKGSTGYHVLNESLSWYLNNQYPDLDAIDDTIDFLQTRIKDLENRYQEFVILKAVSSKLDKRPKSCKDDKCPFIKDAIEALSFEPDKNIAEIQAELNDCNETLKEKTQEREKCKNIIDSINFIKSIERYIINYGSIINKLPNGKKFTNRDELVMRISSGDSFKEIDDLYQYIQYANVIELYHTEVSTLNKLKSNYENIKNKSAIIDELIDDINTLNQKLNKLDNDINENRTSLIEDKRNLIAYKDTLTKYDMLMDYLHTRYEIKNSRANYINEFNQIRANIQKIRESVEFLNSINSNIETIDRELQPLKEDLDKLKYNMRMYIEYTQELETYRDKFEKIEFIKKHSSPSQGIQLLFVEMYMGQTIQLANELLSRLFNGNLTLCKYIINESEFRIPCLGENLPVDDISSLSTSQKCMVSMIVSFALLQQASPKYNIIKLDEIDGGLDTFNRRNFIPMLEYIIDVMQSEQCILISHNSEIDYSKCDIIVLKHDGIEIPSYGNIIYQY